LREQPEQIFRDLAVRWIAARQCPKLCDRFVALSEIQKTPRRLELEPPPRGGRLGARSQQLEQDHDVLVVTEVPIDGEQLLPQVEVDMGCRIELAGERLGPFEGPGDEARFRSAFGRSQLDEIREGKHRMARIGSAFEAALNRRSE